MRNDSVDGMHARSLCQAPLELFINVQGRFKGNTFVIACKCNAKAFRLREKCDFYLSFIHIYICVMYLKKAVSRPKVKPF